MYVCVRVCTYVCVHVCMYVCTRVRMYVCACARKYVCMYKCCESRSRKRTNQSFMKTGAEESRCGLKDQPRSKKTTKEAVANYSSPLPTSKKRQERRNFLPPHYDTINPAPHFISPATDCAPAFVTSADYANGKPEQKTGGAKCETPKLASLICIMHFHSLAQSVPPEVHARIYRR